MILDQLSRKIPTKAIQSPITRSSQAIVSSTALQSRVVALVTTSKSATHTRVGRPRLTRFVPHQPASRQGTLGTQIRRAGSASSRRASSSGWRARRSVRRCWDVRPSRSQSWQWLGGGVGWMCGRVSCVHGCLPCGRRWLARVMGGVALMGGWFGLGVRSVSAAGAGVQGGVWDGARVCARVGVLA